jgi:hypothetical protein
MVVPSTFVFAYACSSYLHCEWRTCEELELGDKRVMQKIKRFKQKKSLQHDYLAQVSIHSFLFTLNQAGI